MCLTYFQLQRIRGNCFTFLALDKHRDKTGAGDRGQMGGLPAPQSNAKLRVTCMRKARTRELGGHDARWHRGPPQHHVIESLLPAITQVATGAPASCDSTKCRPTSRCPAAVQSLDSRASIVTI